MKIEKEHMAEILASLCNFNSMCTLTYCDIKECPLGSGDKNCADATAEHWLEVELPDKEDDNTK